MKRIQNLLIGLVSVILVLGTLSGCTPEEASSSPTSDVPETITPEISEITVTDMAGRTVTVPAEITNIATFGSIGVINTFVEMLGCGRKIMNQMSPKFTKTDKWKYQFVFAPQIANGPLFEDGSTEIQIEAVLAADPDLCLCMSKETATLLEEKGLTVVYFEWEDFDDITTSVTLLGKVLGKEDVAEDYLNYFDEMVSKADTLTAGINNEEKKSVVYGNIVSYTQPHAIAEWWIDKAGGISVTNDGHNLEKANSYTYTLEDLLLWNPEVMVTTAVDMKDELIANSRLSEIKAIVNDETYCVPTVAHTWGNRTVEQPLTVMWMMNKLYPDIMTENMLKEEIRYFYTHFFLTELTDAQIMEIIGK